VHTGAFQFVARTELFVAPARLDCLRETRGHCTELTPSGLRGRPPANQ
jgi:hypothetical protein